jgi:hypothetical protein
MSDLQSGEVRQVPGQRRRGHLIEHVGASLWTIWLAWPFLRLDRYVVGFDTAAYTGPNLAVERRQWSAGHIPLWDSGIFGGVSHLANPTAGALYPLKFLGLPFSLNRSLGLLLALHLLILANGLVFLVGRTLARRAPAGLVAAVAFTGSGMAMTKSLQFEQMLVLAWLPWLCAGIYVLFVTDRPRRAAAVLAVLIALTLLAGHPQIVYIELPLLAAVSLATAVGTHRWKRFGWLAAGAALGGMLAAPQLLMSAQATGRTAVASPSRLAEASSPGFSVDPARLVQTVLGNVRNVNPVATSGGFETVSFVGIVAFLLATIGAFVAWRRYRTSALILVVTAVGGVSAALGPHTIAHRAAVKLVPGYAMARVPARWMIVPAFLVAVAAGEAIHAMRSPAIRIHSARIVVLAIGVVLVASAVGARQAPGRIVVMLWVALAAAVTVGCWLRPRWVGATILCLLLIGELGRLNTQSFGRALVMRQSVLDLAEGVPHFLQTHPGRSLAVTNDAAPTAYLVNGFRPNTNNLVGARSVDGYDGGVQVTSRWIDAMGQLNGGPLDTEFTLRGQTGGPLDTKAWARFGLHYLVVDHDRTDAAALSSGWRGPVFSEKTLDIWENPSWVGEATLTDPTGVVSAAVVTERRDGAATIATTGAGVLRFDEQYTPEWTATIDGKKTDVLHIEGFSVGVTVPAGAHIVQLRYDPPLFRIGLVLSVLALVALLGLVLTSRLPKAPLKVATSPTE